MNPYDFVKIPGNASVMREPPIKHHKFAKSAKHGRIICSLETLTPLFTPNTDRIITRNDGHKEMYFLGTMGPGTNVKVSPYLPGSSIKGVIRSVAETAGNGCFLNGNLPPGVNHTFEPCSENNNLCITCRIFGMLNRGNIHKGKISISDARAETFEMMGAKTLKPLMEPKPRHTAFYNPGGRKFYFHHAYLANPSGGNLTHWTTGIKNGFNSTVNPVAPGALFEFGVDFANLTDDEFSLLFYSLVLEPSMRHKIGLAKPLGLGSVHITISKIILIDPEVRYSSQEERDDILEGERLQEYLTEATREYRENPAENLVDLRRIWNWNPKDTTIYRYPTQDWFGNHSQEPIARTP